MYKPPFPSHVEKYTAIEDILIGLTAIAAVIEFFPAAAAAEVVEIATGEDILLDIIGEEVRYQLPLARAQSWLCLGRTKSLN